MKRLFVCILIIFLASCQKTYDVDNEISSLNNKIKENVSDETAYIDLFNAYIIKGEYYNAIKTLDESLKETDGAKTKDLIKGLKDGYDVYDSNGTFYKKILIDYDFDYTPSIKDERNVDYYQGKSTYIGNDLDSVYYDDYQLLSSNHQKLFKKSNYTVYLLDKEDKITDIYYAQDEHYRAEYKDDGSIFYVRDDGWYYCFKNELIYEVGTNDGDNEITFEYDTNDNLVKLVKTDKSGTITTEYELYDNGSPSKVICYSNLNKEIFEYKEDGKMTSIINYYNNELSSTYEFDYDDDHIVYEKFTSYPPSTFDHEYTYTYNKDGYIIQIDDSMNKDSCQEFTYNKDYSEVTIHKDNEYEKIELLH